MGVGAVIGGLISAAIGKTSRRRLGAIATVFGVSILVLATMPNLTWALIAIFPMGAASISFIALANSSLQLNSTPQMRGRVMALYMVAFLGTTPIGAPLVGYISQLFGPRAALVVGAASALVAGPILLFSTRKRRVELDEVF
jgi:predicted MFS family arabinose efflux permease